MAYNRRNGGGGRYNSGGGGYRASGVNPWHSSGPMGRHSQQAGPSLPPAQLAMASNIISKLLTSSSSVAGSGHWNNPRLSHLGIRKHNGNFNKDNRRRSGDSHKFSGRKSGGVAKNGDKRKSTGKVNDENKKRQNECEKTKEQLETDKNASYVEVPSAVLYCHVCSKHMWDCESFEKHIRGRPHELMLTYLDETYKMQVDFMRHQIKAVENQREIDLERVTNKLQKTTGNKDSVSKPLLRSYCPMCDVRFYGPLTGHRKSDRHRKLKQFLHPECKLCDALFHTRLELDEHKLTAGHLIKIAKMRNLMSPHFKNDEFNLIDIIKIEDKLESEQQIPIIKKYEMLSDLTIEFEQDNSENKKNTLPELTVAAESKENNKNEFVSSDTAVEEDTVLQVSTDTSVKENIAITAELPSKNTQTVAYNPNIAIGKELLVPLKGYVCRLCSCFLMDQECVSIHCQTAAHYINYTTMTKMNEATSGVKKRGIDLINDNVGNEITSGKEILQKTESVVKRIKLEH